LEAGVVWEEVVVALEQLLAVDPVRIFPTYSLVV